MGRRRRTWEAWSFQNNGPPACDAIREEDSAEVLSPLRNDNVKRMQENHGSRIPNLVYLQGITFTRTDRIRTGERYLEAL